MNTTASNDTKNGVFFALSAYLIWGLLPLYWKFLYHVNAVEILSNRIFWSMVSIILYLFFRHELGSFFRETKTVFADRKKRVGLLATTLFISINWGLYIWAVNNDRILATSFGYYINPLINILFGVIFLKEKFDPLEKLSVAIAFIGVAYLTVRGGQIPWLALILALSFSLYGLIKKKLNLNAIYALGWETMIITPITLAAMAYFALHGKSHLTFSGDGLLLILSGPVTALPLVLFGAGVRKIPLSMLAFTQYLSPTLGFLFGIFLYREPFSTTQAVSFALVWLSIGIYLYANLQKSKQSTIRRES